MRLLIFLMIFFFSEIVYPQEQVDQKEDATEKEYFSEQIAMVRKDYMDRAEKAMWKGNLKKARKQYKKMIADELIGTYMDNFNVSCLNTNKCCINDYNQPMILMTFSSWCVPGIGEIPVINELADKYKDEIDFVVLFWDDKKSARKAARDLSKHIYVVYVDELQNRYAYTITMLKHSIGFPKVFAIASDKKILQIKNTKGLPFYKDLQEAVKINEDFFNKLITDINQYEEKSKDTLATENEK